METQTSLDLKTGREQVLRIAGAFLILYLWRNLAYGVIYMFGQGVPVIQGDRWHVWLWYTFLDIMIGLPLLGLFFRVRLATSILSGEALRPLFRTRAHFLLLSSALSYAIQYFAYHERKLSDPVHVLGFYWPNLLWPGLLVGIIFYVWPNSEQSRLAATSKTDHQHFDMESAIDSWQDEFSAQTSLSRQERRELETHLRDTLADLLKSGMSGVEAFRAAKQRVGQSTDLGPEFEKVDPLRMVRSRLVTILGAFLGYYYWASLVSAVFAMRGNYDFPYFEVMYAPPVVVALAVARGRFATIGKLWDWATSNRGLFLVFALVAPLFFNGLRIFRFVRILRYNYGGGTEIDWYRTMLEGGTASLGQVVQIDIWPWLLIALLFFILPKKTATSSRPA